MPSSSPDSLKNHLLLASPAINEGEFQKSVILLTAHLAEEGAHGLILNHPTGKKVGHILRDEAFAPLASLAVHHGGPVAQEELTFSAFRPTTSGLHCELQLSAEAAIERLKAPDTLVRAFIGYAGWSAGQLEREIKGNSWFVLPATPDLLKRELDRPLWADLLRPLSPYHHLLAEAPDNPLLN